MVQINWNNVINNSISLLVGAVFIGAAALVWDKSMSIESQIGDAVRSINEAMDKGEISRETLMTEITDLREEATKLRFMIEGHHKVLTSADAKKKDTWNQEALAKLPSHSVTNIEIPYNKKLDLDRMNKQYTTKAQARKKAMMNRLQLK